MPWSPGKANSGLYKNVKGLAQSHLPIRMKRYECSLTYFYCGWLTAKLDAMLITLFVLVFSFGGGGGNTVIIGVPDQN